QAGHESVLRLELGDRRRDAGIRFACGLFAVEQRCTHRFSPNTISSRRLSSAGSPAIWTSLVRCVWPDTTAKDERGTPQALASSVTSAALALPSSGAAETCAFTAGRPASSVTTPRIRSVDALGVSRIVTRTPSRTGAIGDGEDGGGAAVDDTEFAL